MSDFDKYLTDRIINNKSCMEDKDLLQGEIREVMQEILLPGLVQSDFFSNNAFQGGTALRLLYGLKRYSEDLDFTMIIDQIKVFSWENYTKPLQEKVEFFGLDFVSNTRDDKFGNKILEIDCMPLMAMLEKKNIVPSFFTKLDADEKLKVKLETNYSVNAFQWEWKTINMEQDKKMKVFTLPCLFAGKLNAILTRETTDKKTKTLARTDKGRDWFDLLWYIHNKVPPDFHFLAQKLNDKGPFAKKNVQPDAAWVADALFRRMAKLDYSLLNNDIRLITLPENRIILDNLSVSKAITEFRQNCEGWGG
jgi:predicted nucleotidyltransferase component of viral defense system